MSMTTAHYSYLTLLSLSCAAALLLVFSIYIFWKTYHGPAARKVGARIRMLRATTDHSLATSVLKQRLLSEIPLFERLLFSAPRIRRIDRVILESGVKMTVVRLFALCGFLAMLGYFCIGVFLHQPVIAALGVAAFLGCCPIVLIYRLRARRLQKIQSQLPDAIDLVTRALRSGHSFSTGLQLIGDELNEPIAGEFRIVSDEVNFGVSLQQALTHLSERVEITDLRYFVLAVLIQRDSGGNLIEVLTNLSSLIRNRLRLFGKIRVLSADARMSGWVLGVMPFALAGLMFWANPEFMGPLWTDPIGITILKYLFTLMVVGFFIMRKIVQIRV